MGDPSRRRTLKVGSESPVHDDSEPTAFLDDEEDEAGEDDSRCIRNRGNGPRVVPTLWVNTVIAVHLLPLCIIWTRAFFAIFRKETIDHQLWVTDEFWYFFLGADLSVLAFFGLRAPIDFPGLRRPHLLLLYVFGHELTHAIWVWMMGGRVGEFKVGPRGGYITTNKQNVWISLAPYFYPIYSVAVVILYGILACFLELAPYTRWLFFALGITWAFHICFTLWMIPKGQSDLTYHGTFFSLVVIYLMNLALITGLLLIAAPGLTFAGFGRQFINQCIVFSNWMAIAVRWLTAHLSHWPGA